MNVTRLEASWRSFEAILQLLCGSTLREDLPSFCQLHPGGFLKLGKPETTPPKSIRFFDRFFPWNINHRFIGDPHFPSWKAPEWDLKMNHHHWAMCWKSPKCKGSKKLVGYYGFPWWIMRLSPIEKGECLIPYNNQPTRVLNTGHLY